MKTAGHRALIVLRLSRVTEESTSIERQREVCERLCAERSFEIVGYAEDPDVSAGKTSPFERPSLGPWLDQPERFDVLVFYRLDRIVRSARHLHRLIEWGEDYSVDLVSATEAEFDTSTPTGRLMVTMTATFAEMELEAIRERTRSSWHHLADQGLYTGGIPPFGYESIRDESGVWVLRPEPEAAQIIRNIYKRVLDGEALPQIADELTAQGVLSPKDRNHIANGREPKGYGWSTSSLKRCLRNPALMGYSVHRERLTDRHGKPIKKDGRYQYGDPVIRRNPDGTPMRRSEPILTDTEFDQLQAELNRRAQAKKHTNKKSDSLLLRVLECGVCGKPMYRLKGGPGRTVRYRCASHQDRVNGPCENGTVPLTEADEAVESFVLKTLGDSKRMERTWDPGEDRAAELEEVNRALEDLVGQLGLGAFRTGTPQRAALDRRIEELAARQEELSSSVTRASGWVWKSTGERFADWWDGLTIPERNSYLRDMGVRAEVRAVRRSDEFNLSVELGQLDRMVEQLEIDSSAVPELEILSQLRASGAIGQIVSAAGVGIVYPFTKDGFETVLVLADGPAAAMRAGVDPNEVFAALTKNAPLPAGAETIEIPLDL